MSTTATTLTLATGDPLPEGLDLFAPPPPEIGEPMFAASTLRTSMKPPAEWFDRAIAGLLQVGFIGLFLFNFIKQYGFTTGAVVGGIVLGLAIGTAAGYFVLLHVGRASFIGNVYYLSPHGVARIRCKGDRDQIDLRQSMLFEEETDLLTGAISQSFEGIHMSTDTWFHWTDADGNSVLLIAGKNPNQYAPPPVQHPLLLGALAARMWLEHRRPALLGTFHARGHLDFRVAMMGHIRLERGAITFHMHGREARIRAADIIDFTLVGGIFRLRYEGLEKAGKPLPFQFAYANVANVEVFLELLETTLPGIFGGGASTVPR